MQRTVSWAKQGGIGARAGVLAYAGGLAGVLLCALLLMMGGMPAPAAAEGSTICVGSAGDYATIQAAVDAAQDGDTILVAGNTFKENVVITKSITIGGHWNDDCSAKDASQNASTVVHPDTGRAFTIMPDQAGVTITVVITELNAVGNASGLGGAQPIEQSAMVTFFVNGDVPIGGVLPLAAATMTGDWRARVAEAAAQGAIPGAPTADEIMARLAGPQAQASSPVVPDPTLEAVAAYRPTGEEVDCGGAIYAKDVGLRLERVLTGFSVASTTGVGYGGGVCIVDPTGSVSIVDSEFNTNLASVAGFGMGGAMFIQGGDAAEVTLEDVTMSYNTAAPYASGWGGALAVVNTPHFKLSGSDLGHCTISTNVAGAAGNGLGGGIFLQGIADAEVSSCRFFNNYASGGSAAEPPAPAQRSNWLPVQAGQPFLLNARLYWPRTEALDGRWQMPPLERLD